MSHFEWIASVYNFAGQPAADESFQDIADAVCEAMEAPSARLSEACVNALWLLASKHAEVSFDGPGEALRRVGFLADELSRYEDAPPELSVWADSLWDSDSAQGEPLVLTEVVTPSRLRRLKNEGSDVNVRWNVWGRVALRPPTECVTLLPPTE